MLSIYALRGITFEIVPSTVFEDGILGDEKAVERIPTTRRFIVQVREKEAIQQKGKRQDKLLEFPEGTLVL